MYSFMLKAVGITENDFLFMGIQLPKLIFGGNNIIWHKGYFIIFAKFSQMYMKNCTLKINSDASDVNSKGFEKRQNSFFT